MEKSKKLCQLLDGLLAEGRECEWLEFKENDSEPEKIGECLSALSNSSLLCDVSHGHLVFGIRNGVLDIVGTEFSFSKKKIGNQELENWLATQLEPHVDLRAFEFLYDDKKMVIIRVEGGHRHAHLFSKNPLYPDRLLYKKLKEHPEKARIIWSKRNKKSFEETLSMKGIFSEKLFKFIDYHKFFEYVNIPVPKEESNLLEKLEDEELVVQNGGDTLGITNLGAIFICQGFE